MLEFVLQAVRVIVSVVRSRLRASRDLVSKARTVSGIDIHGIVYAVNVLAGRRGIRA